MRRLDYQLTTTNYMDGEKDLLKKNLASLETKPEIEKFKAGVEAMGDHPDIIELADQKIKGLDTATNEAETIPDNKVDQINNLGGSASDITVELEPSSAKAEQVKNEATQWIEELTKEKAAEVNAEIYEESGKEHDSLIASSARMEELKKQEQFPGFVATHEEQYSEGVRKEMGDLERSMESNSEAIQVANTAVAFNELKTLTVEGADDWDKAVTIAVKLNKVSQSPELMSQLPMAELNGMMQKGFDEYWQQHASNDHMAKTNYLSALKQAENHGATIKPAVPLEELYKELDLKEEDFKQRPGTLPEIGEKIQSEKKEDHETLPPEVRESVERVKKNLEHVQNRISKIKEATADLLKRWKDIPDAAKYNEGIALGNSVVDLAGNGDAETGFNLLRSPQSFSLPNENALLKYANTSTEYAPGKNAVNTAFWNKKEYPQEVLDLQSQVETTTAEMVAAIQRAADLRDKAMNIK
ncbi:MAG: hypothetical protein JWM20_710 [Patescibacteria group bacterium]|nr:hypothetical protein [Patescibacteria group bacterium]